MKTFLLRCSQWLGLGVVGAANRLTRIAGPKLQGQISPVLQGVLARQLAGMHGAPVKIAQTLELFHKDPEARLLYREALEHAPPMSPREVLKILQKAPVFSQLKKWEFRAYVGSMAQVHRGVLKDGRIVALKVLHKDLAASQNADEGLMDAVFAALKAAPGMASSAVRKELWEGLRREMDLSLEAKVQNEVVALLKEWSPDWDFPLAYPELGNTQVLVQDWVEHQPLRLALEHLASGRREELGQDLWRMQLGIWAQAGLWLPDLHPGNLGFSPQGRFVLMDFGALWKSQSQGQRFLLPRLIQAVKESKPIIGELLVDAGWDEGVLRPLWPRLLSLFEVLLEPFVQPGRFAPTEWKRKERSEFLYGEHRWALMIGAPANLVPLMRGLAQMQKWWLEAGVDYNLELETQKVFAAWNASFVLPQIPPRLEQPAATLSFEVYRDGLKKVGVLLPRTALWDLENWMDADMRQKIANRGVDLQKICAQALDHGLVPGILFELEEENLRVKVSLV
jgi:predicted unusual protein kinase regulating ubiquinone biosynthesis (AarF/ABC1/UbiB family)